MNFSNYMFIYGGSLGSEFQIFIDYRGNEKKDGT